MVIGITGGIGSGKSLVAEILKKEVDAVIIDTDRIGHTLLEDEEIKSSIVLEFGKKILDANNKIDRKALGKIVFNDNLKLGTLNTILHKEIEKRVDELISIHKSKKYLVIETALLIQAGYVDKCDKIWVIYANKENRLLRLLEERGLSKEYVESIIDKQSRDEDFFEIADEIIDNSKSYIETRDRVLEILKGYEEVYNA